jgi:hypothetical protein
MEKREIKIDDALHIDGFILVPILETSLLYRYQNSTFSFFYSRNPVIVLVISEHFKKAFHISGKELPLEELCGLIPDIAEIVATGFING